MELVQPNPRKRWERERNDSSPLQRATEALAQSPYLGNQIKSNSKNREALPASSSLLFAKASMPVKENNHDPKNVTRNHLCA
jgi:hypothetical protein